MSSRSATVLVIFVVACIAFCLASVFVSMTGPISILPNESDSGSILDNLSVIENADTGDYQSYGYDDSDDYSSYYDDSQSSEPEIEVTSEPSQTQDDNSHDSDSYSYDDSDSSSSETNDPSVVSPDDKGN